MKPARPDLDPQQLKLQIAFAARMLVEGRVEEGPLLIIVEDLHWADAASVNLLRDLADDLADRPLMMLFYAPPHLLSPVAARASQSTPRSSAALEGGG